MFHHPKFENCNVTIHSYGVISDSNNSRGNLPWIRVHTRREKYHCFCDLVNFFYENITMITSARPFVFVGPIGKFWIF